MTPRSLPSGVSLLERVWAAWNRSATVPSDGNRSAVRRLFDKVWPMLAESDPDLAEGFACSHAR